MDSASLVRNGITYITAKAAAPAVGITADYITKLCRKGAVNALLVGNTWYVEQASVAAFVAHKETTKKEHAARNAQQIREATRRAEEIAQPEVKETRVSQHPIPARTNPAYAFSVATIVLLVAMSAGTFAFSSPNQQLQLLAAASASLPAPIQNTLDRTATAVFDFFCPLFSACDAGSAVASAPKTTGAITAQRPSNTATSALEHSPQPPQPTIIERILEKTETIVQAASAGITEHLLDARLAALEASFTGRIDRLAYQGDRQAESLADNFADGIGGGGFYDIDITESTFTGGSISGASLSDVTFSGETDFPYLTVEAATSKNATSTNLYVSGSLGFGSGTGLLRNDTGIVSTLSNGSNGQVLKIVAGNLQWSADLTGGGGGGASYFASTTDDLAIYPADPSDVLLIGTTATTTTGNILEVSGNALLRGTATTYGLLSAPRFTATSSLASVFPYASTTALSATTLCLSSDCRTSWPVDTSFSTTSADYWQTQRNFFSTSSALHFSSLGLAFSTTSADAWKSERNFFSTTSADYWSSVADLFSTTSADAWKLTRNFFSTTSADNWETQQTARTADDLTNNSIEDLSDVAVIAENYGDLLFWNGSNWADISTSSLGLPTSATLASYLTLSDWFATTTDGLDEGSLNRYFTDARADARINATSSIGTLTGAPSLTTIATSLTGILRATAGAISTALVNLASDITGILPVANGGTGWANIASAAIPYGNGTGALSTTTAGTNGQVLALLGGVPTWTASSTLATISGTLDVGKGGSGATSFSYGLVLSPGGTSGLTNIATSSLGLLTTHVAEGSNLYYQDARVQTYLDAVSKGYFFSTTSADVWKDNRDFFSTTSAQYFAHSSTTIPKLYSSNAWTGSNSFSTLTLGSLNGPLHANAGVLSATSSIGVLYGGTGLTTRPTYGQVLVGNASGGYTLTATSSLGISSGSSFAYPFPANATTTMLNFSSGLLSLASTTIGNGTQAGGLSISGGATTTGDFTGLGTSITLNDGVDDIAGFNNLFGHGRMFLADSNGAVGVSLNINNPGVNNFINVGTGLGIGVEDAQSTLDVAGNLAVGSYAGVNAAPTNGLIVSGNVGIGTTTPAKKLDVLAHGTNGNIYFDSSGTGPRIGTQLGAGASIELYNGSTGATRFQNGFGGSFLFDGGNIGIATSTPWAKLSINSTAGIPQFVIGSSTTQFIVDQNGNVGIGTSTPSVAMAGTFGLNINGPFPGISLHGTEASGRSVYLLENAGLFRLSNGGSNLLAADLISLNIGIGTTSPTTRAYINETNTSAASVLTINIPEGGGPSIHFFEGGTQNWELGSNYGTDRLAFLDTDETHGVALDQNSNSWISASDARLKINLAELHVLERLDRFNAYEFDWKSNGGHDIGVLAQDLYAMFPEVVSKGTDDGRADLGAAATVADPRVWGVQYDKLGAISLQGVKELNLNLAAVASTTASTTPRSQAFATAFLSNLFTRLVQWFADTRNGIQDLFATNLHAENIAADIGTFGTVSASTTRTAELCLGAVCVTEAQFMAVFGQSAATAPATTVASLPSNSDEPPSQDAEQASPQVGGSSATSSPSQPNDQLTDSAQPPHANGTAATPEAPAPDAANDSPPSPASEVL